MAVFYDTMPWSNPHLRVTNWLGKEATTFSDMIASVRYYSWGEWFFKQMPGGHVVQKLPKTIRAVLEVGLAQAA